MVWLGSYGVWATRRYEQVREVLTDWRTFMSGAGVGLTDLRVDSWRPPSLLLEADPPAHTTVRSIIEGVLSPKAVKRLRDTLEVRADSLVVRLLSAGSLDAVTEFAEVFPLQAFSDAVGVRKEGRENLRPTATASTARPRNELFEASTRNLAEVRTWIMDSCRRKRWSPVVSARVCTSRWTMA